MSKTINLEQPSVPLLHLSMTNHRLTPIKNDSHEHHHDHHSEDDEEELSRLPATIFDANYCGESVPDGFDAVRILIDGTVKGDLSWKKEKEAALAYCAQGLRIFWEIDLGLINSLNQPLSNTTQFLALSLSIEHFCKTLWKEFYQQSVGLCLYRGKADYSQAYPWDEDQTLNLQAWIRELYSDADLFVTETGIEVADFTSLTPSKMEATPHGKMLLKYFCRDAVGEYLDLLAARVPDNIPLFLMLATEERDHSFLNPQLLTKERYPRFHLCVKHDWKKGQIQGGQLSWENAPMEFGMIGRSHQNPNFEKAKIGFCLPSMSLCRPSQTETLSHAFKQLEDSQTSFRVIPESMLMAEWEGLDYLVVDSQLVGLQFKRQLQGFCAAGGTVLTIGTPIGLANEIPFEAMS